MSNRKVRAVKNPTANAYGQVICEAEILYGEGVGASYEWANYVASRGDVSVVGNTVWAKICKGEFTIDSDHEINFNPSDLEPD